MEKCVFEVAGCRRCTAEATDDQFCARHKALRCVVCKKQATKECDYTEQFICDAPLCENCKGFNDQSKPNGRWSFMSHKHKV